MLAARAQCPVDRLDDALLVTDAIAAHAPGLHRRRPRDASRVRADDDGARDARRRAARGRRRRALADADAARASATCSSASPTRSTRARGDGRRASCRIRARRSPYDLTPSHALERRCHPSSHSPGRARRRAPRRRRPRRDRPLHRAGAQAEADRGDRGRASTRIVVDLTETTFLDSTALGVLIGAVKRLRSRDGALVIVNVDSEHRQDVRDHRARPDLHDQRHARRGRRGARRRRSRHVLLGRSGPPSHPVQAGRACDGPRP